MSNIYFLNRGLILEQTIVEALKTYFEKINISGLYNGNVDVINITNDHPFSELIMEGDTASVAGKFPAIVVSTVSDDPSELSRSMNQEKTVSLEKSDISQLKDYGYAVTDAQLTEMTAYFDSRTEMYGVCYPIARRETISVEVWAENIQLKNELYEYIRLFFAGEFNNYLESIYSKHGLYSFSSEMTGQRSNNYNFEFGVKLAGAQILLKADYIIEQTVMDTALSEINENIFVEVANHVKNEN